MSIPATDWLCASCNQDIIRGCRKTIARYIVCPCLISMMEQIVAAAETAGLSRADLLDLVNSGASLRHILDLVEQRLKVSGRERSEPWQQFCA